ncbi:MAG: AAA family ATPase, partial [Roseiflexaceae bacterium]
MRADIILIGPPGTGKSTVGELLAAKLAWPQCSMDELRWEYYREIGYDSELQKSLWEQQGFDAVMRYWKPFEAHAVERLLGEHRDCRPGCVIDFGAGHSFYEDEAQFARVQQALAPFSNIVLLLPSADLDES